MSNVSYVFVESSFYPLCRLISRRQYKLLTNLLVRSKDDSCQSDAAMSPQGENRRPLQQTNSDFQSIAHCTLSDFGFFAYSSDLQ
jgi:hypothetical protein